MTRFANRLPQLAMIALLGACTSTGERYPSLAIRDAERAEGSFDVAPAPVEAPAPQSTLDRVSQLAEDARRAHARFLEAVPGARQAVARARGASVENDRWALAQVALADLDSIRSEAAIALGDLDLLFADATLGFTDRDRIASVRDGVVALVAEEDAVLNELRAIVN